MIDTTKNYLPFDLNKAAAGHPMVTRSGKRAKFIKVIDRGRPFGQRVVVSVHSNILNRSIEHQLLIDGTAGRLNGSLSGIDHKDGLDLFMVPLEPEVKPSLSNMFKKLRNAH